VKNVKKKHEADKAAGQEIQRQRILQIHRGNSEQDNKKVGMDGGRRAERRGKRKESYY